MGRHARRRHGVGDPPAEVQPAGASEHIGARVPEGDAEMVAAAVRTVSVQRRALGDDQVELGGPAARVAGIARAGRVRRPRAVLPHQVSGRLPLREAAPAGRHEEGTWDEVAWSPTKSPLTAAMKSVDPGVLSQRKSGLTRRPWENKSVQR